MSLNDSKPFTISFDGKHYTTWKFKMQTWLQSKNLREFIDEEASEDKVQTTLDGKSDEEKATYLRKRLKAYTAICMAMPESHIHLAGVQQSTKIKDA